MLNVLHVCTGTRRGYVKKMDKAIKGANTVNSKSTSVEGLDVTHGLANGIHLVTSLFQD